MNVDLEVGDRTWTWRNGSLELEATDPTIAFGLVRAVVTVREEGAILERTHLNLTSERERARFRGLLEGKGRNLDGGLLLALEAAIREANPVNGSGGEEDLQGRALALSDPEAWPEPVDGAALLEDTRAFFGRFAVLPEGADVVFALFSVTTHAAAAAEKPPTFRSVPYVVLVSPVHECGKTLVLELLALTVRRPWLTLMPSTAVLFRVLEQFHPTMLLDECQAVRGRGESAENVRDLLLAGYKAGATVPRCVGESHEVRFFDVFGPKAFALIGELPPALASRCIRIQMRRRRPDEELERWTPPVEGEGHWLARQAARWANDNREALREADPQVPEFIRDRQAEIWSPLLAVAEVAGGEWPERAREAAKKLSGEAAELDDAGLLLLEDLRQLFEEEDADRLASSAIVEALVKLEDRPWPEWRRGQPLTATSLARLLRPYGVRPKPMDWSGIHPKGTRGYPREALEDVWARYTPPSEPQPPQPSSNGAENGPSPTRNLADQGCDSETGENPHGRPMVAGVAGERGGPGAEEPPPELWDSVLADEPDEYEAVEREAIRGEADL